jgi:hypothetical protein
LLWTGTFAATGVPGVLGTRTLRRRREFHANPARPAKNARAANATTQTIQLIPDMTVLLILRDKYPRLETRLIEIRASVYYGNEAKMPRIY